MTRGMLMFSTGFSGVHSDQLVLVEARGREAMSSLYEYELTFEVHQDYGLAADQIDGLLSNTCYIMALGAGTVEVHGMLRSIKLLASNETHPVAYTAIMVPRLWNTTRVFRTRVFQEMNVQQIVDRVLTDHGLAAEWWLTETYPTAEYTVQYEETDFNFISRLLEHFGIFYFFRQEPDGEVLVIGDRDNSFEPHPDYGVVTFNPNMGRSAVGACVHSLSSEVVTQTGGVTVREYNWRTPMASLAAKHDADTRSGFGAHWCYGEHFKTAEEGAMIARIRAEQELNRRESFSGMCSIPGLRPGHKITLTDNPLPDLNITYLVTDVVPIVSTSLIGDGFSESYQYPFSAVALERDDPPPVPFRSQRLARKPVIHGFMHGIVDGEVASTAAPIDDEGRYRIIMPMDSVAELGGRATRWIRMIQPSSGANYGMHFPLHIGTEVAIIHLDGDPDRPVIVGSVPNPSTTSPIVRQEATRSRIRTRSGIEIEFEDDA